MRYLLLLTLMIIPCSAFGEGTANVPTDAELTRQVAEMKMPRLEHRLRARAAAYRLFEETVTTLGYGAQLVQPSTLEGTQYASLRR